MNGLTLDEAVDLLLRSGLLDPLYYMKSNSLGPQPDADLARHYLEQGEAAKQSPNMLFDPVFYNTTYLKGETDRSPVIDYIQQGHGPRCPHPLFDQPFYLRTAAGAVPQDMTPLAHYRQDGWELGFDPHPLFSIAFYREQNEDVRTLGFEPFMHFTEYGWRERRNPCPGFDVAFYLDSNPDIAQSGMNPLVHFVWYGAAERRKPSPDFDFDWYAACIKGDPDAGAYSNPLAHYLHVGRAQGYTAKPFNLGLDSSGSAPRTEFDIWSRAALKVYSATMPARPGRMLLTVVDGRTVEPWEEDVIPYDDLPRWLGARRTAEEAAALLVVTQPGDHVIDPAREILATTPFSLFTLDSVILSGDEARPVLLPGANRVYLLNTSIIPPFCASVALCRDNRPRPGEALPAWFRRLLTAATEPDAAALGHVPLPAVIVPPGRHPAIPTAEVANIIAKVATSGEAPRRGPVTSVIICTKDSSHLLMQLVTALLDPETDGVKEVILVINQPQNPFSTGYHAQLAKLDRVRVIDYNRDYNFSDQCNEGARLAQGEFLLFLNDDIVPIGHRWLQQMLRHLDDPRVAVVGPLLLYPDQTVQHAGMYLGFNGACGHILRGTILPRPFRETGLVPANCSAVTGAVILMRATLFADLNGFDYSLATHLQDLDFCLRVLRMGHEIVYTPESVLFHMESVSTLPTLKSPATLSRRGREHERFYRRWQTALEYDRFHNLNWLIQDDRLSTLAAPQPSRTARLFND